MLACQNVPAAAWRLLGKAEWPTLKKADFQLCLGKGAKLAGALCLFVSFFLLRAASPPALPGPGAQVFL